MFSHESGSPIPDTRSAAMVLTEALYNTHLALADCITLGYIRPPELSYIMNSATNAFTYEPKIRGLHDGSGDMKARTEDLFRCFSAYESAFPQIRKVFGRFLDELKKEPRIKVV